MNVASFPGSPRAWTENQKERVPLFRITSNGKLGRTEQGYYECAFCAARLTSDLDATDILFLAAPSVEWVLYIWGGRGGSLSQSVRLEQAQWGERRSPYWTRKTFQLHCVSVFICLMLIYIGHIRSHGFSPVCRVSCLWMYSIQSSHCQWRKYSTYMYIFYSAKWIRTLNKPLDVMQSHPLCRTHFSQYRPHQLLWCDFISCARVTVRWGLK